MISIISILIFINCFINSIQSLDSLNITKRGNSLGKIRYNILHQAQNALPQPILHDIFNTYAIKNAHTLYPNELLQALLADKTTAVKILKSGIPSTNTGIRNLVLDLTYSEKHLKLLSIIYALPNFLDWNSKNQYSNYIYSNFEFSWLIGHVLFDEVSLNLATEPPKHSLILLYRLLFSRTSAILRKFNRYEQLVIWNDLFRSLLLHGYYNKIIELTSRPKIMDYIVSSNLFLAISYALKYHNQKLFTHLSNMLPLNTDLFPVYFHGVINSAINENCVEVVVGWLFLIPGDHQCRRMHYLKLAIKLNKVIIVDAMINSWNNPHPTSSETKEMVAAVLKTKNIEMSRIIFSKMLDILIENE